MKQIINTLILVTVVLFLWSCNSNPQRNNETTLPVDREDFQTTLNGKETDLFTLSNENGMKIGISNFGGRIVSWLAPDRDGNFADIVFGFSSLDGYLNASEVFYGPLIGRFGNRIAEGTFTLDGETYNLPINNGPNHLHGGPEGFHNVVWDAIQLDNQRLLLEYLSEDGEQGYPGNLRIQVIYALSENNELTIDYAAVSDEKTIVNLTNHAFFNLGGEASGTINNHIMEVNADGYTPVDSTLIPLGTVDDVSGTPFDFRNPTAIGERVDEDHEQLRYGAGYDHNFVLNKENEEELTFAVRVQEPESGRTLSIYTTEPALQFYGGNFMDGSDVGKFGESFEYREALVLEPQHYPDSPNQPEFPSTELEPFEFYRTISVYKITAD